MTSKTKIKALALAAVIAVTAIVGIAQPFRRGTGALKQATGCVRVEYGVQNVDLEVRLNLYHNLGGRAEVVVEPSGLYTIIVYPEGC